MDDDPNMNPARIWTSGCREAPVLVIARFMNARSESHKRYAITRLNSVYSLRISCMHI